jgi:twinkle protein
MNLDWAKYGIDVSQCKKVQDMAMCPKCGPTQKHKNAKKLSVNTVTGQFNCKNVPCDFKGSAKVFEPMAEKKVYKKPEPRPKAVGAKLLAWFNSRKISNETLLTAKVTEGVQFMPQISKEANCACFNYFRDGELINIKYRDGAKHFSLESGAELIFYNLDAIQGRSEAIITEGEIDCLSLIEIGLTNAVSVPNGAAKGNQKLVYLDNCIDYFDSCEKIILATDADEPGELLKMELIRRLGAERCYTVKYPADCKDANEVLVKHGKETLFACIGMAKQCDIEGIFTADSQREAVHNISKNGFPAVVKIDYIGLNDCITWRKGELTVVTGIPGSGKSEIVDQIALKLAVIHRWRFGVFSPENQPTEFHVMKLVEKYGGEPIRSHSHQNMTEENINKCIDFLDDHFFFMKIGEIDMTIDGILSKAAELVKRKGIDGLIIDPYNYIEQNFGAGMTETQMISVLLSKIKIFKEKYGVHVFVIAHPTKLRKEIGKKTYELPTLYDISGGAHWFNKCDNGIVVNRNKDAGLTEVHIQKVRFKFVGKPGVVNFAYDTPTGRYTEEGDKFKREIGATEQYESTTNKIIQGRLRESKSDREEETIDERNERIAKEMEDI